MTTIFPYTPFPFNVTAISPSFHLSPVASNVSLGWTPSCITPECLPTASWSTTAINSTLLFDYKGWDVTFDGNVTGNMSVELFSDGKRTPWNPSGDELFSLRGGPTDYLRQHSITLRVLGASPGSQLTVTRARVNGSSQGDFTWPADRWIVPSDDDRLDYTGFDPQPSVIQAGSSTTYISNRTGDSVSMLFNNTAFLIYGPCGPKNGLMRVTIDGNQHIVNTSKPFASDDCLLFQSQGQPMHNFHQFVIENVGGGIIGIDRFDFFRIQTYQPGSRTGTKAIIVSSIVLSVIAACVIVIVMYVKRSVGKQALEALAGDSRAQNRGFVRFHS